MNNHVDLHLRIIFQYVPIKMSSLFDLHRNGGNISRTPRVEPQASIRCPSTSDCTSSSFIPCRGPTRRERENLHRKPSIFPHEIWWNMGVSWGFLWFLFLSQSIDSGRMLKFLGGNVDSLPACASRLELPSKCPDLIMAWLYLHVDNDLPNIPPPHSWTIQPSCLTFEFPHSWSASSNRTTPEFPI